MRYEAYTQLVGILEHAINYSYKPRTNEDRVEEAWALLACMHVLTGVNPNPDEDGIHTTLSDLLAHLMHLCNAEKVSFEECLQLAQMHYKEELIEDAT